MSSQLVLGIDLGLSGARAAVMDFEGTIVGSGERFPVATSHVADRVEQDPADWLKAIEQAAQSAISAAGAVDVKAIGVTAFGPAPVIVDKTLAALTPAALFGLDARAESQRRRLAARLGLTDAQLTQDHAIPTLTWWEESHPEWWGKASWAMDATGFIVSAMTGTPVMDTITACDYTLEGVDSPVALPPATDPLSVAGPLSTEWGTRLGLPAGTAVFTGTYDSYGDTAAAGALAPGDACMVVGSTIVIVVVVEDPPSSDWQGLITAPHLGEGLLFGGWTSSGGTAMAWARKVLGAAATHNDDLERTAIELLPGSGGLLFLPYLAGERSPVHDPRATGTMLGLTLQTSPADFYRAVIDGVALSVKDHTERLRLLGQHTRRWRVTGGGAASPLLGQALADAIGSPLDVVTDAGSPLGPCQVALRGLGLRPTSRTSLTFEPRTEAASRFDDLYAVYQTVHPRLAGQMHELGQLNQDLGGTQ